jgi:hypothetical protein
VLAGIAFLHPRAEDFAGLRPFADRSEIAAFFDYSRMSQSMKSMDGDSGQRFSRYFQQDARLRVRSVTIRAIVRAGGGVS